MNAICSMPLLPLSRYVKLYFPTRFIKYFSNRACIMYCASVWCLCVMITFSLLLAGQIGIDRHAKWPVNCMLVPSNGMHPMVNLITSASLGEHDNFSLSLV